MKKAVLILMIILCLSGCVHTDMQKTSIVQDTSIVEDTETTIPTEAEISDTAENTKEADEQISIVQETAYYDDVFKGFSSAVTGLPISYEETVNMINDGNLDSFYLVLTHRAVPLSECELLSGWDEIYADRTMYEVRIVSDLITGENIGKTIYVLISMGTPEYQDVNDPTYAPGELFTVALTKEREDEDFVRSCGGFMFRFDAVNKNGEYTLYSRNNTGIDEPGIDGMESIDEKIITSTTDNPVLYTKSVSVESLSEFIREDWSNRKICSHFEEKNDEVSYSDNITNAISAKQIYLDGKLHFIESISPSDDVICVDGEYISIYTGESSRFAYLLSDETFAGILELVDDIPQNELESDFYSQGDIHSDGDSAVIICKSDPAYMQSVYDYSDNSIAESVKPECYNCENVFSIYPVNYEKEQISVDTDDTNPNTTIPYSMMYKGEMRMLQFLSNSGIYLKKNGSGFEVCYAEDYISAIDTDYINGLLTADNCIGNSKHVEDKPENDLETDININFIVYYINEDYLFAVCENNLFSDIPKEVYDITGEEILYTLHCFQPEKWQWSDEEHEYPYYL